MKTCGVGMLVASAMLFSACKPERRTWTESLGPLPQPTRSGEALSPVGLDASERIVIFVSSTGSRSWYRWRFEVAGGAETILTVIDAGTGLEDRGASPTNPVKIGTMALSAAECRGLHDLIEYFRHPDPVRQSTVEDRVRIEYFRGPTQIGDEQMTEQSLGADNLVYFRDHPESGPGFVDPRITKEMVSFRQLFRRVYEANHSPEATPGTRPPATPSPSSGAPHL